MIFNSLSFLFAFLPIFLIVYFCIPERLRLFCLLLGSLFFYGVGVHRSLWMLALLLLSALINAVIGGRIAQSLTRRCRRRWLLRGIVYNLFWLLLFKYANPLLAMSRALFSHFGLQFLPELQTLPMPPGISFYTFAALSYLIDVSRRDVRWERSIPRFAAWFSMFPQLLSGPITRYKALQPSLLHPHTSLDRLECGLREFTIGLGLKVLLADRLGGLWAAAAGIGYDAISPQLAWMALVAYSLQLYFDFYGYSLMAKGLGFMLGFELPDNFNHPYVSLSMTDFWRRWHMTLGAWFRDYVYIPLGGSRGGKTKTLRNLLIVWMLTGIWHGAHWNFLLWAGFLFLLIGLEKSWLLPFLNRHRLFGHVYMCLVIPLSWLLFALQSPAQIALYLQRLFPLFALQPASYFAGDFVKYGLQYGLFLATGLLFMTPLPRRIYERWKQSPATAVLLLFIFWLSVHGIVQGANDPFLYFNF